jgi:hypothetical protein
MAKDALDKILDGDIDGLDTLEDDDDGKEAISKADLKALQDQLAAKDKEIHGMLTELKGDRAKRQTAQRELAELKGTVNGILQTRNAALEGAVTPDADKELKAAVEYTDDGDGYIQLDQALNPVVDKLSQEIKELKDYILQTDQARQADAQGDALIQSIVGEKPEYSSAYSRYKSAHKWLDDRVTAWQNANGVQRPLTGGEALDYVFTDASEFNETFPGMDIADVLFAEDSQYQLRTMLDNVSKGSTPDLKRPDTRFQKVLGKPSGLGSNANANAEVSVVEKAGNLGSVDIMALSDEAAAQLEAAMLREEKSEGIKY